jgi:hypothetical protein
MLAHRCIMKLGGENSVAGFEKEKEKRNTQVGG